MKLLEKIKSRVNDNDTFLDEIGAAIIACALVRWVGRGVIPTGAELLKTLLGDLFLGFFTVACTFGILYAFEKEKGIKGRIYRLLGYIVLYLLFSGILWKK